jgi:hypothetical protein
LLVVLLVRRSFLEFFGPTSPFPMPQQLQSFLHHLQEQLLQEPVFRSHSVLYELMTAGAWLQAGTATECLQPAVHFLQQLRSLQTVSNCADVHACVLQVVAASSSQVT